MDNRELSAKLSVRIDEVIGNEEMNGCLRSLGILKMFHLNAAFDMCALLFHNGSEADGSTLQGSDQDFMLVLRGINVIKENELPPAETTNTEVPVLRIVQDHSSPGSVLLELMKNTSNMPHTLFLTEESIVHYREKLLVSSTLFIDEIRRTGIWHSLLHNPKGPCVNTGAMGMFAAKSRDIAFAFNYPGWPSIAEEWRNRKREYGWPSESLILKICNHGCHIVPIGHGGSHHSSLTWRITFAFAETLLAHSLNREQLKVYILLKMFHKQILTKGTPADESLLCSYFMKTIIFHAVENSPASMWTNENIVICFWMCFMLLISFVETGYLPNYFIPANNMFQHRVHGKPRCDLLNLLYKYRRDGTTWLESLFANSDLQVTHEILQTPESIEKHHDRNIFECRPSSDGAIFNMNNSKKIVLQVALQVALYCFFVSKNDINIFSSLSSLRGLLIHYASHMLGDAQDKSMNNSYMYSKLRTGKHYLIMCASMDVSRGWLTLATYYYLNGQYRKAINICEHVKKTLCGPCVFYKGTELHDDGGDGSYVQDKCGRGISFMSKMKHALAETFCIELGFGSNALNCLKYVLESRLSERGVYKLNMKRAFAICPLEIMPNVKASKNQELNLAPQPYAIFLEFLCFHMSENMPKLQSLLEELLKWKHDAFQGESDAPMIHTLIGICQGIIGEQINAESSFLSHLRCEPENKVTSWRLANIHKKLAGQVPDGCNELMDPATYLMNEFKAFQISPKFFALVGFLCEFQGEYADAAVVYKSYLREQNCTIIQKRFEYVRRRLEQVAGEMCDNILLFYISVEANCDSNDIDISLLTRLIRHER